VREADETLDLVTNLLSLARQGVSYERVSADGCVSDNQAVTDTEDAEFGRCCGHHVLVRAVSHAFGGDRVEACSANLSAEGFKRVCSSRSGADNIVVVKVSDILSCRTCRGYTLEGSLVREGEQEGAERVPLLHAAGGGDGEESCGAPWRRTRNRLPYT
jgi:hypothetical protein